MLEDFKGETPLHQAEVIDKTGKLAGQRGGKG